MTEEESVPEHTEEMLVVVDESRWVEAGADLVETHRLDDEREDQSWIAVAAEGSTL